MVESGVRGPWQCVKRWGVSIVGGLSLALTTGPATPAAETIRIQQGLFSISISVEALEEFTTTGEVPPALHNTLGRLNDETLANVRQRLTSPLGIDVVAMSQLANSNLGDDYLTRMGKVVRTPTGQNGALALRAAHIAAAQDPEGLTSIGVIRHFPTDIRISFQDLRNLNRQTASLFDYKVAALSAIQQQAEQEVAAEESIDFAGLEDLRLPGPFSVVSETLTLVDPERPGLKDAAERTFAVDLYRPQTPNPAPIVIISHGWGSSKENFAFLGEHLASYGFAVAIPQHIASDQQFQRLFLSGVLDEDIPPREYVDRPLDISFTLDELERLSSPGEVYEGQFNLEQVGMIGHSLGGYTTLAIAGASINYARLQQVCIPERPFRLNMSIYLQCRAAPLPPVERSLEDDRVDAAIALNPITSVIQGPSQLEQIQSPLMLAVANFDLLAPPVQEQIHPFTWLTTDNKYLVAMSPAGHGTSVQFELAEGDPHGGLAPNSPLGSIYARALATAFMQVYTAGNGRYAPYLSAGYADYLSTDPITLDMVQSLRPEQLEAAYGRTPPLPLRPGDGEL